MLEALQPGQESVRGASEAIGSPRAGMGLSAPSSCVAAYLSYPSSPDDAHKQRSADSRKQEKHPEGEMPGRTEVADRDHLGVFEDEDQKEHEYDHARQQALERRARLSGGRPWPT